MAKYKVLRKCFLAVTGTTQGRRYDPGEIIDVTVNAAAAYLQPVDDAEALARWKDAYPHAPRSLPVGL